MANTPDDPLKTLADSLRKPLRGRRFAALLLLVLVLGGGLLWPMWAVWQAHTQQLAGDAQQGVISTPGAADRWWDAGPLDTAHAALASDCRACHSEPFARVKDSDCQACHAQTVNHVATSSPAHADGEPRCASCHREHQGPQALAVQNEAQSGPLCIDCHQGLKQRHPQVAVEDAADFAAAHPEFRVQLADATGGLRRERLSATPLLSNAGLRFTHDAHTATDGIDGPDGRKVLACGDCHRARPDGVTFEPVRFEADCRSCHSLVLEAALPGRQLPHGDVDAALSMIREFYSFATSNGEPVSTMTPQRPGRERTLPANFAGRDGNALTLARQTATEVFESTSCAVCHVVTRSAEQGLPGTPAADLPRWSIAPVAPSHPWMPAARFDHKAHAVTECSTCHAAPASSNADEVLMPGIAVCRDCHAGQQAEEEKLRSDCGVCHGYHPHAPSLTVTEPPAP